MPKTQARVSFGLYNLVLKQDSRVTCSDEQPFVRPSDLATGNVSNRPYASYEPDFWLLDGNYKFLPTVYTTVHTGLISLSMSDAGGEFSTPPVLRVAFTHVQSIDSLSLTFAPFSGDFATSIAVAFYDASNVLIRSDAYSPAAAEFSTGQAVANFKKIEISFYSTNRPYRYLRVTSLDYGEVISFEGGEIKQAEIIEELDQLSAEVRYGTLDLTVFSADADFSIINPSGIYATLHERQPVDVYETIDGGAIYIGRYYLDEWQNKSDNLATFHAIDILGVMDRLVYRGSMVEGLAIDTLLETLLSPVRVPYELDNSLVGTTVTGWLRPGSYRQALQQICFAIGASISSSRSGAVRIFTTKIAAAAAVADAIITRSAMGVDQSLALKSLVTSVEVTSHDYISSGEIVAIVSGQYEPGTYEITWNDPIHALSVTGATIIESGVNFAVLSVAVAGAVVLTGLKYIDITAVKSIVLADENSTVQPNILQITEATLVNKGNVDQVAQRVFDYHQQRFLQKVKLFAPTVEPGDVVILDTLYNKKIIAVVEKMSSNLAQGFTSQVELTGVEYELV